MDHNVDLFSDYNYLLILLALFVASCASFCALEVVAHMSNQRGAARRPWLLGGAVIFGIGVWAMHFIGMLAFNLPMPIGYHVPTVLFSMLPAIGAATLALALTSTGELTPARLFGGAVLMALGIGGMHYSGMFAMRMDAVTYYEPLYVLGSVVFAVLASIAALYMAFSLRGVEASTETRAFAGFVLGMTVTGLHVSAMFYASHFTLATEALPKGTLVTPWTLSSSGDPLVVHVPTAAAALLAIALLGAVAALLGRMRRAQGAAALVSAASGD